MYILMISRGIPSAKDPQWGCFEQDQAEALQRYGHKVVVATVDSRFRKTWRKIGITHKHKDGVDYYNSFWIPGAITNLISSKFTHIIKEKQLDRIYRKIEAEHGKPDVIYGQFFFNTLLGAFFKKKYGIPLVGIEHAARFVSDNVDAKSLELASLAYKSADCNIAVSSHLAKALNRLFNISCEVVHNVYNPFFNAEVFKKQIEKHDPFKFVAIGTLEYRKGYDILISSFKKFQNKYLNSTLTIIGEGEEHATLTNLLIKDGLENCVSLVGQKNKEEIATILSDSDVFVLASRSETFGVVFIEAMALGLPVIGTYCGGPDGIINKSNGVIVPVDDRSAFFDAMEYVYNNYSMYDKDTIIKGCKENYSSIAIAKKLTLIFEKVLKEKQ